MLIERYLLRLSLRRGFKLLREELVSGQSSDCTSRLFKKIPDIEIAAATIREIIEGDGDFGRYPLALRLLETIRDQLGASDQRIDQLTDHALYYTKVLHILSKIGHKAAENVTELLLDYFPNIAEKQALSNDITQAVYSEMRTFVLKLLLKGNRSRHFAKKFPDRFSNIPDKLRRVLSKLLSRMSTRFASCELTRPLDRLSKRARMNPAVLLYYEKFHNGGEAPTEEQLVQFVQEIRQSQLSIDTPQVLILPTPNEDSRLLNVAIAEDDDAPSPELGGTSHYVGEETAYTSGSVDLLLSNGQYPSPENVRCVPEDTEMVVTAAPSDDLQTLGISTIYDCDGDAVTLEPWMTNCVVYLERVDSQEIGNLKRVKAGRGRHRRRRKRLKFMR